MKSIMEKTIKIVGLGFILANGAFFCAQEDSLALVPAGLTEAGLSATIVGIDTLTNALKVVLGKMIDLKGADKDHLKKLLGGFGALLAYYQIGKKVGLGSSDLMNPAFAFERILTYSLDQIKALKLEKEGMTVGLKVFLKVASKFQEEGIGLLVKYFGQLTKPVEKLASATSLAA